MYVPLKITTDYSLLKSTIKIDKLISFLLTNKIDVCAICDEYLYGVMEFYNKCIKNKIKPIIGLDVVINDLHLYLYAKNYEGYQNLLKLNSIKTERGLGVVDLEIYKKDILVIIPYESLELYNIINFFEDLYIGYQNDYEKTNALIKSERVVYVNDICSLNKEDTKYLNYLNMILNDEKMPNYEFQSYEKNYFKLDVNENDAKTTIEVSDKLNLEIPKNENYIPKYSDDIEDSNVYLENLTKKGLFKRLNGNVTDEYKKRLEYELSVIKNMGFSDYILIVYDYVLFAKKNNVFVGPGRGSAAGSLVCYTLGITDIDPLKYNLLFERFLNPERVTMPDIDIDFENTKRGEVIEYIKVRYGIDKVASIMTFATLKSKLVLREVNRVTNGNEKELEYLIKNVNANLTLKENLENEIIKNILNKNERLKELYRISMHLEGLKKNISTHAAGVVISKVSLDEVIPIVKLKDGISTGITMEYLEELGLLKMDLLAIKNLTMISNILELIKKDTGKSINLNKIDLNDKSVLDLFTRGDTTGIFQFESSGMRSFLEKLKPRNFNDIVASIALYRPGPMDNIDTFIKRKEGKEEISYIIPELEPILKETEGIIVYQEQVMQILVEVSNYTFAEADLVRRAMSKKKKDILESEKQKFIERATKNGYGSVANKLYDLILKFANYGFNKSHSVAYALIGYQMAYLKVKFPKYFITNLLNMSIGSEVKTNEYIMEAKKHNLEIIKPDINLSFNDYKIENNKVILPFSTIKGLSSVVIDVILKEREENGLFLDFIDFARRMYNRNINERILEILINAGVFREFGDIATLHENMEVVLNYAELASSIEEPLIPKPMIKKSDVEIDENKLEYESYGFYISNHPVSKYNSPNIQKLINITNYFDKYVHCVVLIESIKYTKTKKNEDMAFIEASDETGSQSFVVFSKQIRLLDDLKVKDIAEFQGRVTKRYDKYQININNIIKM